MEYDAEMALYTLRFVLVCIGDDAVDRGTATGTWDVGISISLPRPPAQNDET